MDWVRENWFFLLVWIIFIAMHLFGHGMNGGGCGGHGEHGEAGRKKTEVPGKDSEEKKEHKGGHGCC